MVMDRGLRFDCDIKQVPKKTSLRLSSLLRVITFLDRRGKLLLRKSQILPYLEYVALS